MGQGHIQRRNQRYGGAVAGNRRASMRIATYITIYLRVMKGLNVIHCWQSVWECWGGGRFLKLADADPFGATGSSTATAAVPLPAQQEVPRPTSPQGATRTLQIIAELWPASARNALAWRLNFAGKNGGKRWKEEDFRESQQPGETFPQEEQVCACLYTCCHCCERQWALVNISFPRSPHTRLCLVACLLAYTSSLSLHFSL